jgi:hypothetical protein
MHRRSLSRNTGTTVQDLGVSMVLFGRFSEWPICLVDEGCSRYSRNRLGYEEMIPTTRTVRFLLGGICRNLSARGGRHELELEYWDNPNRQQRNLESETI